MKYYQVKFCSYSRNGDEKYTYSKNGILKDKLNLDYNGIYLASEEEIPELINNYDVYSITYVGIKWQSTIKHKFYGSL